MSCPRIRCGGYESWMEEVGLGLDLEGIPRIMVKMVG